MKAKEGVGGTGAGRSEESRHVLGDEGKVELAGGTVVELDLLCFDRLEITVAALEPSPGVRGG